MSERSAPPKSGWPVVVLGVLSFIPGLGLLLGPVSLCWAFLTSRPRARLAGILGVLGFVANFVLIFLFTQRFYSDPRMAQAQALVTTRDLERVVLALENYHATLGAYPEDLEQLATSRGPLRPIPVHDQATGLTIPLQNYQYTRSADGESYDLYSAGRDKTPGTEDDIAPALSDSLAAASGYRPHGD